MTTFSQTEEPQLNSRDCVGLSYAASGTESVRAIFLRFIGLSYVWFVDGLLFITFCTCNGLAPGGLEEISERGR
jgi:hypothetical protein